VLASTQTFSGGNTFAGSITFSSAVIGGALLRQYVSSTTCALWTARGAILPYDDTIPQISEGWQVLVATITPTRADSRIEIEARLLAKEGSNLTDGQLVIALFQDQTANAIAAGVGGSLGTGGINIAANTGMTVLTHIINSTGSTTLRNFSVRVGGPSTSQICVNCDSSNARVFGGVACSTLIIREIAGSQ